MRILLLSDIHANIQALEAVLEDCQDFDEMWCAGDLVDYGTSPHEVVSFFRNNMERLHIRCVSGNHDRNLIKVYDSGETEILRNTDKYKWVHDNIDHMTADDVDFLRDLPEHLTLCGDGIHYIISHQQFFGELTYRMPESLQEFDNFWQNNVNINPDNTCDITEDVAIEANAGKADALDTDSIPARRLIFGHTHRRCVHMLSDNTLWMNPGSVSYRRPDDKDKRAHYMTIDEGSIHFHAVRYNRQPSFERAMEYVKSGNMLITDLQDAMFFFGNAQTSRDALPKVR